MIKRQRSYSGERDRKIQLRKGEAEDGSYEKMEDSFDDGNDLKEFLPEDLYQCLEEENRFLEAGDAINGRVPVAIGIFDTDLKKDLGLSGNCAILALGRQTPHKDAVIEMLRYEFMDEDDPQKE